jgi:hypothetical protein
MPMLSLVGVDLAINVNTGANQVNAQIIPRSDGGAFIYWIVPGAASPVQGGLVTASGSRIANPFNTSADIFYSIGAENLSAVDLPDGRVALISRSGNIVQVLTVGTDGQGGSSESLSFSEVALTGGPVAQTLSDGRIAFFLKTSAETQASFSPLFSENFDDLQLNNGSGLSLRDSAGGYWTVIAAAGIGATGMAVATQVGSGIQLHLVSASSLVDTIAPTMLPIGANYVAGSFKLTETSSGDFFASWIDGTTIEAQRFNASGQAIGQRMEAPATAPHSASITLLPDGRALLLWDDRPGADYDIYGRTFTATGVAECQSFLVNRITAGDQTSPSAAVLGDGDIFAIWNTATATRQDTVGRLLSTTRPDAVDDTLGATTGHPAIFVLTGNDSDPNGDAITLVSVGAAAHGSVSVQNGLAIYTAPLGTVGRDSFTYTLQDSHGLTDTATVFVTIGAVENDFDGDGRSDLLWRSDSGAFALWSGTGAGGFNASWGTSVSLDWKVGATGDFNGDGKVDVLWRSDSGSLSNWLGGASGFTPAWGTSLSTEWHVAGTGDFNGDGSDDVVWRSDSGALSDWLGAASGGFAANWGTSVSLDWTVVGTGDFNGDGHDDLLWRSNSGAVGTWLGTGAGAFVAGWGTALSTEWSLVGVDDFSGDGRTDILWRSTGGTLAEWLGAANGGFTPAWGTSLPGDRHVASIGDFNADGRADLLWRSDAGQLSEWLGTFGGGFAGNAGFETPAPAGWNVQDPFL